MKQLTLKRTNKKKFLQELHRSKIFHTDKPTARSIITKKQVPPVVPRQEKGYLTPQPKHFCPSAPS